MTHALKTWPQYFKDIQEGRKTFELRKDDRGYNVGDILVLQEFDVDGEAPLLTGNECTRKVNYILRDAKQFGLMDGYCIMGLVTPEYSWHDGKPFLGFKDEG